MGLLIDIYRGITCRNVPQYLYSYDFTVFSMIFYKEHSD